MKFNFSKAILDLKGRPIKDGDAELTLGAVAAQALTTTTPSGRQAVFGESVKRFKLAMRLIDGGEAEVSDDEVAAIKEAVGQAVAPLIVGRVSEILDAAQSPSLS
jgi:hypothetical protein